MASGYPKMDKHESYAASRARKLLHRIRCLEKGMAMPLAMTGMTETRNPSSFQEPTRIQNPLPNLSRDSMPLERAVTGHPPARPALPVYLRPEMADHGVIATANGLMEELTSASQRPVVSRSLAETAHETCLDSQRRHPTLTLSCNPGNRAPDPGIVNSTGDVYRTRSRSWRR
jgi:hypothetical protein